MILEMDEYVDRIAARTVSNTKYIRQSTLQRRDQVTDLHGVEYTRAVDPAIPATFYVTVSRDMVYLERFGFKLIIAPYTQLTPDVPPVIVPVADSGYRVSVDDVDVTPYLAAQHDGWIGGQGVFPSLDPDENYDLLEAACDMRAAGDPDLAEIIVAPGYKKIEVSGTSLFMVTLVLFLKHSHTNR